MTGATSSAAPSAQAHRRSCGDRSRTRWTARTGRGRDRVPVSGPSVGRVAPSSATTRWGLPGHDPSHRGGPYRSWRRLVSEGVAGNSTPGPLGDMSGSPPRRPSDARAGPGDDRGAEPNSGRRPVAPRRVPRGVRRARPLRGSHGSGGGGAPRYPCADMSSVWTQLEPHLAGVEKPARYIGLELGAQRPVPGQGTVSWLLTYPDTYEIGLPNQGLQILYEILNERDDAVAERVVRPVGRPRGGPARRAHPAVLGRHAPSGRTSSTSSPSTCRPS